jgi:DNA-binding transcriptional LysR family regulator
MNATFRQLRLFLALADHKSITAAARACHVTQPTVSMQLKELAEAVGMPLYEQIGKRLYLTEAGEALVLTARAMVDEWSAFEQRVDAMKGLTRGRLRLAVVSTAKYFVPGLLGRFCANHPDIDIALEVLNRDGVLARLRENRDDLYIMSMPPTDIELDKHVFLPNPLVVIAPRTHPLAGTGPLRLADLAQERFIMRERGSGTRLACDAHFAAHGFSAQVRLELGSNEAIKQSVAAGMGLAVISRHALAPNGADENLVELPVSGFPVVSNWWTLHPKGKRLSPLATVFLAHLQGTAASGNGATPADINPAHTPAISG